MDVEGFYDEHPINEAYTFFVERIEAGDLGSVRALAVRP